MIAGTTLLGFVALTVRPPFEWAVITFVVSLVAFASFVFFSINASQFLIGRTYKYIWTLDEALKHKQELDEFSKQWPDAPSAQETFNEHLLKTIAFCASHNAKLNDKRSENLYRTNISALTYILASVVLAAIAILGKILRL